MPDSTARRAALLLLLLAVPAPSAAGPGPTDQLDEMGYYGEAGFARVRGKRDVCDGAVDGRELIGARLPAWSLSDWANWKGPAPTLAALRGKVVVVRFWTAGCQFCEKTLPALQQLARELGDQPVVIVGAFHGKPESSATDIRRPLEIARGWGVTFPIALDRRWKTLRSWWLDGRHRHATSVTIVIGKDGRVVHVHPGPVFYPTDNPAEKGMDEDYKAVKAAVLAALNAP